LLSRTAPEAHAATGSSKLVPVDELRFQLSVAVAWMLIGGFGFMMALFYLVNHSDKEIRMYSWEVISSTVNIFCAVLIFSACNSLVEYYAFHGLHHAEAIESPYAIAVDFLQMFSWIAAMLFVLWLVARRARQRCHAGEGPEKHADHHLDVKCWAMLFAHTAGFAAINAFGDLQQNVFFSQGPAHAFLIVPLTTLVLASIFKLVSIVGDGLRRRRLLALGHRFYEIWMEETEEAENDMTALAVSFLTCQALRFYTGGHLPDPEGEEPPKTRAAALLFCSLAFAFVGIIWVQFDEAHHHFVSQVTPKFQKRLQRVSEIFLAVCCMCCAWCSYYGMKRSFFYLLSASSEIEEEDIIEEVLRISLGVANSALAFLMILCLNYIVDAEKLRVAKTNELIKNAEAAGYAVSNDDLTRNASTLTTLFKTDEHAKMVVRSCKTLIKAMAILVGFSWEQAFDSSVAKTCERATIMPPAWAHLSFSVLMIVIVAPAWRWYILPLASASEHAMADDASTCKGGSLFSSRQVSAQ